MSTQLVDSENRSQSASVNEKPAQVFNDTAEHSLMSAHVTPLPVQPESQAQVNEDAVSVHIAWALQLCTPPEHSFTKGVDGWDEKPQR